MSKTSVTQMSTVFQSRMLLGDDGRSGKSVAEMRVHDYLYDPAWIMTDARDHARAAFKAAMASSQPVIQPVYKSMFSEISMFPRMRVVLHPNCRLPPHMDLSFDSYIQNMTYSQNLPVPKTTGPYLFKYTAQPNRVLATSTVSPELIVEKDKEASATPGKPKSRGTQSLYRESSAQTKPWQPDGIPAPECENKPEVLFLDNLEWGPGRPYRKGDLPADFHTTEIINKMRHARAWTSLVEKGGFPRWMKKNDAIITDIETKDWIFREGEIDELQEIRLALLHKLQTENREISTNRTGRKLANLWQFKKSEMERKVRNIRRTRDRELRKLTAIHEGGGRLGSVQRMRAARGGGVAIKAACDPTSDLHAPLARHGVQARRRHARICYDPGLLSYEDHKEVASPPAWLESCGQDLVRTCSGHHKPRDPTALCERETKWSEQFLENLHNDLKKARLGAATITPGPLHVLKPKRVANTPRPSTPEVEAVHDDDEACHQSALLLQKIIRGRAVQMIMYEGRTRAAELTEELKTTHGLQKEDKIRIALEEAKSRDYHAHQSIADQKEKCIFGLVDEVCGSAVAAALDFLEKELRRLKEERRQHAFILIAMREKTMREAAEAGRRQKEERRRREHDEIFKQVIGVTQETIDDYLKEIVLEGVELAVEEEAVRRAKSSADKIDQSLLHYGSMSTADQNELVAELVQQFLIPEAHKMAVRHRISETQRAKLMSARDVIFGVVDEAEIKEAHCLRCGRPLDDLCRCRVCPRVQGPKQTKHRDDPRWKYTIGRPRPEAKDVGERYPPEHEFRCLLNTLIYEVVSRSRERRAEEEAVDRDCSLRIRELTEITLDAKNLICDIIEEVIGAYHPPVKRSDYHYVMHKMVGNALDRSQSFETCPCPKILPSEIRRRSEEEASRLDPTCRCDPTRNLKDVPNLATMTAEEKMKLLPSDVRILDDLRRCKCDVSPPDTSGRFESEVTDSDVTTIFTEPSMDDLR